jgi:hypothetical protein
MLPRYLPDLGAENLKIGASGLSVGPLNTRPLAPFCDLGGTCAK